MDWRHHYVAGVLVGVLLAVPAKSGAAYICWIDRVESGVDGVKVYFTANSTLSAFLKRSTGRNDQFTISRGRVVSPLQVMGPSGQVSNPEFDSLLIQRGDTVQVRMGAHDNCTLTVIEEPWGLGVRAEAQSTPHGIPASKASALIRPDGNSRIEK